MTGRQTRCFSMSRNRVAVLADAAMDDDDADDDDGGKPPPPQRVQNATTYEMVGFSGYKKSQRLGKPSRAGRAGAYAYPQRRPAIRGWRIGMRYSAPGPKEELTPFTASVEPLRGRPITWRRRLLIWDATTPGFCFFP